VRVVASRVLAVRRLIRTVGKQHRSVQILPPGTSVTSAVPVQLITTFFVVVRLVVSNLESGKRGLIPAVKARNKQLYVVLSLIGAWRKSRLTKYCYC
jgi:hypothetical protein